MGKYEVHQDSSRQWRWRYVASNGKIIAVSSEAYVGKADCLRSIEIMKESENSPTEEE
jgi:uncharacterized protein YegP (UPF0339 family)